jgi:hypothetical protein
MTDHEIIEKLARSMCIDAGIDPDNLPPNCITGPYGDPHPWFAPDGIQRPWHKHVNDATSFLRFYRAMRKLEELVP